MSGIVYDPPDEILSIFNPINYFYDMGQGITQGEGDLRYIKKAGDTATGSIYFSNGLYTSTGAAATPSVGFIGDSNTGIYNMSGSDQLGFSTGGTLRLSIDTATITSTLPIQTPSGSVGTNAVQVGAVGTGLYSSAGNTLNVATNGVNRLGIDTATITSTLPIQVPSTASITNCGLQVGLANTGLQYNAGVLYFGLGGTQMMRFQAAQIYSSTAHNFTNGSTTNPSVCAASYQTTGLSWAAGPILNFSTSAVRRGFFNTTGFAIGDLGDAIARKNFGSYTFTAPNLSQHGTANTTITYTNAFASTPKIYLTTSFNSATSTYMYGVLASASDVGTTTFKINICNLVNNATTGDIVVNWIAEL